MTIVTKETIDGYEVAIQPSDKLFVLVPIEEYKELVINNGKYYQFAISRLDNWSAGIMQDRYETFKNKYSDSMGEY